MDRRNNPYAPGAGLHGETAFTVPLFNEFMKRQMPKLEKHEPKRRR